MIHHELGGSYVLDGDGRREPVECRDPRALAMDREDRSGRTREDDMLCMIEAARDWLWWIFEAGPHPVPVMRRLVACTSANAPWLLQLNPREVRALSPLTTDEQALRTVCRATSAEVQAALAQAYRRAWDAAPHITTLEMRLVIEQSLDGEDALMRGRAMEIWLARVWESPRLCDALKALYVEARMLAPEMILNMSGEEISTLFRQGRAAESARVKQRVNVRLLRAGFRRTTLRFQKSETACRTYAERQRGNKNRAGTARNAERSTLNAERRSEAVA